MHSSFLFDVLWEGHFTWHALSMKEPATNTPLLLHLLQLALDKKGEIQPLLSTSHDSAGGLVQDDDLLRSLPSERQLQPSTSMRDESVEFDELQEELAQTSSCSPSAPGKSAGMSSQPNLSSLGGWAQRCFPSWSTFLSAPSFHLLYIPTSLGLPDVNW